MPTDVYDHMREEIMRMGSEVREDVPLNVRIDRVRRAVDLLEGHMTGHDVGGAKVNPEPSVSRPRESMDLMITSMGDELAGLEERIAALAEMLHRQISRL